MTVQFGAARADEAPGAELLQAMKEEMADLYEGLMLTHPICPRLGPSDVQAVPRIRHRRVPPP